MGDFNAVLDDSEVSGNAADTSASMAEFLECITDSELHHLPFTGANFTWHNCSDGERSLWKRLDRMLVNEAWLAKWPQSKKLKLLKPVLRSLRKTHGDLSQNVKQAAQFLQQAQRLIQDFKHESILLQLEKCCRMIFCKATIMEVNMLKQRAKLAWLKGGDNCSKIFFRKITARRAYQRVYQIQNDDGHILTEEHEIKDALFDINEDSAPGPDGFSSSFFKATWAVIGEDVCRAIMEFFNHGRLLKQLNATLLTLIPKVQMPTKVGDFRPISCCNVIYKIITKIMVKRMQFVLEKLIDNCQNAFVPGRSISDNVLLAQELLSGYNQKKLPPRCTIKVDLQKAYDMVDWDYLLAVLRLFRFPNRFIAWVEQCITTASFSISLNGTIHGFFTSTRGLRQGDPISHISLFW
ncbi:UNVERIFIED_CONTAM: hypothetical protein Scaly_3070300 [Sesamum calycinum]|uniref:Reverse transcriptase domain-containing protein n=1 Tax=Sesamum calycinum TaxID=2727403 RepID=A0AAW2JUH7_9LAMI